MSRPIQEPSTQRQLANQGWRVDQLERRPAQIANNVGLPWGVVTWDAVQGKTTGGLGTNGLEYVALTGLTIVTPYPTVFSINTGFVIGAATVDSLHVDATVLEAGDIRVFWIEYEGYAYLADGGGAFLSWVTSGVGLELGFWGGGMGTQGHGELFNAFIGSLENPYEVFNPYIRWSIAFSTTGSSDVTFNFVNSTANNVTTHGTALILGIGIGQFD